MAYTVVSDMESLSNDSRTGTANERKLSGGPPEQTPGGNDARHAVDAESIRLTVR